MLRNTGVTADLSPSHPEWKAADPASLLPGGLSPIISPNIPDERFPLDRTSMSSAAISKPLTRPLTSGPLLGRNTVWNLLGSVAPALVAIFCVPVILRGLGTDRFGVLTLAWSLIGYASLLDLGLGRAMTKLVAEALGREEMDDTRPLAGTGLLLMLVLGLAGGVILALLSPWLVERALRIPAVLRRESLESFYLLALSIPVVIVSAGLRGLLQAFQRFDLINIVSVSAGILSFASPLLILAWSNSLAPVVALLVGIDFAAALAYLWFCLRVLPGLHHQLKWQSSSVRPLLQFGGWMTVSNVVSPLMFTMDRFLIGTLVSVGAVAYYATPHEAVTKLFIIPAALVSVLFPAFSTSSVQDARRTVLLFGRAVKFIFLLLFPATLMVVAFAGRGLSLWLGGDFAMHSEHVLQWLAVGVFLNSLAQVPFALLQGVGRPDLTAKFHLLELPCYLLALWYLTRAYGIEGAAITWLLRIAADASLLFFSATRVLRGSNASVSRLAGSVGIALFAFGIIAVPMTASAKLLVLSLVLIAFAVLAWCLVLGREDRAILHRYSAAYRSRGLHVS